MKLLLRLHNFLYKVISRLAILKEGLHPKHRLMNYHQFFTDNVSGTDTVLDIGCGNGALTFDLAGKVKSVIGVDYENKTIFQMVHFLFITPPSSYRGIKVDVIVLSNVLEHIDNRILFLKDVKKSAKKFLIRVPMLNRDWLTLYKKELGVEYRLDKTHFIEYTEESFRQEVKEAGYKIVKLEIRFGEIYAILK